MHETLESNQRKDGGLFFGLDTSSFLPPKDHVDFDYRLQELLTSKYISRQAMEHGPFLNPAQYFFVIPSQEEAAQYLAYLKTHQESDRFNSDTRLQIFQFPEVLLSPEHTKPIRDLVRDIINGKISLPLVYKPNVGALGSNVFFIESTEHQDMKITLLGNYPVDKDLPLIIKYLKGAQELPSANPNISQFILKNPISENTLYEVLMQGSVLGFPFGDINQQEVSQHVKKVVFQGGVIESKFENMVKYNGKTFETRHQVYGNLFSGEMDGSPVTSIAKVGGSEYFGTLSDLVDEDAAARLEGDSIFQPLFEDGEYSDAQKVEFKSLLNEALAKAFEHFSSRVKNLGSMLNRRFEIQFDLCWIRDQDTFKPGLIEVHVRLVD